MAEMDTIRKQIVSIDIDKAASQRVKQYVTALKGDFAALSTKGRSLQEAFVTQGASANRLYGQIANLNDAYQAGSIGLAQYQKENARLNADLRTADTSFGATTQAIRETDNAIKTFYQDVKTGAQSPEVTDPTQAMRSNITGLSRTSSAIGGIGRGASVFLGTGVMSGFGPAQQITQAFYGVQALTAEFPSLADQLTKNRAALVGFGGALGAVGLAIYAVTSLQDEQKAALERSKAAWQDIIDKTKEFYGLVQDATSEDIQNAIDSQKSEIAIAQRTAEETKTWLDQAQALQAQMEAAGRITGRGSAKTREKVEKEFLPVQIGPLEIKTYQDVTNAVTALNQDYADQTKSVQALDRELINLQSGFEDTQVIANDAAAATEAAIQAWVDSHTQQNRFSLQAQQMSAQQIRDRLAQIRQEQLGYGSLQRYLTALAPTSEYAAQQLQAVNATMQALSQEAGALQFALPAATIPENQQLAGEVFQRIVGFATQGAGIVEQAVKAVGSTAAVSSQKLDQYRAHMSEVEEDRLRQSIREEEDAARSRTRAIADHYLDLAKLDEQYYEKRQDIVGDIAAASTDADQEQLKTLRETNQAALAAARAHSQRLIDIQTRTNSDIRKAALRLDAVGIWEAQKAGEAELKQEARTYNEEQRQRDADTRDRLKEIRTQRDEKIRAGKQALRDLETQHTKERGEQERTFQAQLRREDQDRAIRQQRQQQDWALQDQRYRAHNSIIESVNSQHYGRMAGQTVTGMGNVANAFSSSLSGIAAMVSSRLATISYTPSYNPGWSGRTTPTFAVGGTPPVGRDVIVGEHGWEVARFMQPARVYSHADSMKMAGGVVIKGDIKPTFIMKENTGRSDAELNRFFMNSLKDVLTQLANGRR